MRFSCSEVTDDFSCRLFFHVFVFVSLNRKKKTKTNRHSAVEQDSEEAAEVGDVSLTREWSQASERTSHLYTANGGVISVNYWGVSVSSPTLSSLPLPFSLFRPLISRTTEIQLGDLGERFYIPQKGLGRSPIRNRIWSISALTCDIWLQQFEWFSWESTDQIACSLHSKGQSRTEILSLVVYAGLE